MESCHLFHEDVMVKRYIKILLLITYGTIMKKDAVIEVGNFDPTFKKCEDLDLGHRL